MDSGSDKKLDRRDYLKGVGATGAAISTAGCIGNLLGPDAPDLRDAVDQAEQNLESELPWGRYALNFNVQGLDMGIDKLGSTGVEDAFNYAVSIDVGLSGNSDDISGWLSSEELAEEFWRLYAPPTYDMLVESRDSLQEFTAPDRPSNRNRIVEYDLHVGAENCSYIEDSIPAPQLDDVVSSPDDYIAYLDDGEAVNVVYDDGALGFGHFC